MKGNKNYYLGLDIGTDSVGYAVTDEQYNLIKFRGEPVWGVTLFDEASHNEERRSFRSSRRRLDRRQQRVQLIQELFAPEIAKVDEKFFKRLKESAMYRSDVDSESILFNDEGYCDKIYYDEYPTIHHLIDKLMKSEDAHDVRLVYLACAWLVKHRGHFLSNIDRDNLAGLTDFTVVYDKFISYFPNNGYEVPWTSDNSNEIGDVLKKKQSITNKQSALVELLYNGKKPSKEANESFPFSREIIVKLLAGSRCKVKDLFLNDEYEEIGSFSLGDEEEKFGELMSGLRDDYELIAVMRAMFDWSVLVDSLGGCQTISKSKVLAYEQHKKDLTTLKKFLKKYKTKKEYDAIFREFGRDNYPAYVRHSDEKGQIKLTNIDEFSKYVLNIVKDIMPLTEDKNDYTDMINRLQLRTFMPKQKNTDNRVLPHQLYWYELHCILEKSKHYLPFLNEKSDGISVVDKIESVFLFKIPYFVGPLNKTSSKSWIERKSGKIYPWNFEEMVDLGASEEVFIKKMINTCTYLPDETVLPKCSITYQKFMVLNTINTIRINGEKISVELKQRIYRELFQNIKKVTKKKITDFLICNGIIEKGEEETVTGVDFVINASCTSWIAFRRLIETKVVTLEEAERIIERSSFAEDKKRVAKWLEIEYPSISPEDRKYICSIRFSDFGRLSHAFLCDMEGASKGTGEVTTILREMWETQNNLNEILSNEYTFSKQITEYQDAYYSEHAKTLSERLDEMYISNAVKRPIFRTLDIIRDINKAFGEPTKIFVEMTRGGKPGEKGNRVKSRKDRLLELYAKCKDEDVRYLKQQLEAMGDIADQKLRGDKLFLYYLQLGKSAYSGQPIALENLASKDYDVDHIYPQAYVKDDSITNNKVLCLSSENGAKSDIFPISEFVRNKMGGYWYYLKEIGLINDEKYKRLTRNTPFSEDEKYNFINRQLIETSQSSKAIATLLRDRFKNSEIVYCKAQLTSEFRQEFDLLKSRSFNDLHHAVDAYLNIVTGNVYNMKFTKKWFNVNDRYSVKTKTLFTHPQICNGITVWDGQKMLGKVKQTAGKNAAHLTKFTFFKQGGFFDQMPLAKGSGLVPLKKGLPTEKYGGYNKSSVMFFIPVRYKACKKDEIIIMSVELMYGKQFLENGSFAQEYAFRRLSHILGKEVDEVSFPMGMRPWKINTMLSLDGFRVCIAGIRSGGKTLIAQPFIPFSASQEWQVYFKRVERITERVKANSNYVYDVDYDYVTKEKNAELYRLYVYKLEHSVYKKRVNAPTEVLKNGEEKFMSLDIKEQCIAILNIHQIFGRISGGCDLTSLGGAKKAAATVNFSSTISNWQNHYSDVRIIDASSSGLWLKTSENLLELL